MAKTKSKIDDKKAVEFWNKILKASINMPGAKVDRSKYLHKELSKRIPQDQVERAIKTTPAIANVSEKVIRRISTSCIRWHTIQTTSLSFGAGLPGGWWIAGTIPADLVQFYWHIIQVVQKLAYLYGWPDFTDEEDIIDDETLLKITLFIGVMYASEAANMAIKKVASRLAQETVKRLPKVALTKYGFYNIAKQVGKWVSVKVTKDVFAKNVGKAIPILGGFISGGVTFFSFRPMSNKLVKHLKELELAKG